MPNRLLSSTKIVKGERRMKYRNLFQIFFMPNRILSSSKIVKAESRGKWKTKFSTFDYAEPHPVFSENSHFRESHTRSRLKKRERATTGQPTPFYFAFFSARSKMHIYHYKSNNYLIFIFWRIEYFLSFDYLCVIFSARSLYFNNLKYCHRQLF